MLRWSFFVLDLYGGIIHQEYPLRLMSMEQAQDHMRSLYALFSVYGVKVCGISGGTRICTVDGQSFYSEPLATIPIYWFWEPEPYLIRRPGRHSRWGGWGGRRRHGGGRRHWR